MTPTELATRLAERLRQGAPAALVTVTATSGSAPREPGAKMLVFPDGTIAGTIGGGRLEAQAIADAVAALAEGKPRTVSYELEPQKLGMYCAGQVSVFIDVFCEPLRLLILGAGHVGEKVAALSAFLGVPYAVVDDRAELATAERYPHARRIAVGHPDDALKRLDVDERTAIVIVTRCHGFDLRCMVAALGTRAFYIGMIGSATKTRRLFELCRRRDLDPAEDPRVHAPIGLDLGGRTPEAIALSILSEILMVQNSATGRPLRDREETPAQV